MKKKLIIVVIICLSLFIFRDFIIRQYFISKIEYVDYDEYILIDYLNGKKNKASYVGADFMIVLEYDLEGKEIENVTVYDYNKMTEHQQNLSTDEADRKANNENRPMNLNNDCLLELLKSNAKFKYKSIETVDNRKCYKLEFEDEEYDRVIYLNKELLFIEKIEEYSKNDKNKVIYTYELDLELKNKDLFKEYIN